MRLPLIALLALFVLGCDKKIREARAPLSARLLVAASR